MKPTSSKLPNSNQDPAESNRFASKLNVRQKIKLWWKDFWVIDDDFFDDYEWDDPEGDDNRTNPSPENRTFKRDTHGRTCDFEEPDR